MPEKLISSGELASRLGVARRTVSRWVEQGIIKPAFVTAGGKYRFLLSEVMQQLREHGEG